MKSKKGQAAMEFLMTYGWAILAAVLAIGVLAYYGVFSPGNSVPSTCTLSAPLGCDEYEVTPSGVRLILINGAGDAITLNDVTVTNCGTNSTATVVADGDTTDVLVTCGTAPVSGTKFSGKIDVNYLRAGKTINQTSTGDIRAEVA